MPAKKTNTAKIIDVAEPDKVTPATTSRPIIVTNRPMIAHDPMVSGGDDTTEATEQQSAPTLSPGSDSKITIKPLHTDLTEDVSEPTESKETESPEETTPEPAEPPATEKPDDTDTESTSAPDETDDKTEPETESDDAQSDTKETDVSAAAKSAAATKAEAAAKQREAEMLELIASRQFFVPVEPVERRKADRTSLWLTLLVLLLAALLVDLMLDANVILLVEKIPHTHFFSH